jgi:hypothetical protein
MSGTLQGGEIFSMNLSMAKGVDVGETFPFLDLDNGQRNDIADDCASWFGRASTRIHPSASLTRVKIAPIGTDGRYTAAPFEAERIVAGAGSNLYGRPTNDQALALTLYTAADLGRVKGRIYQPLPTFTVGTDGRYDSAEIEDSEASFKTLINDLNNEPGFDVLGLGVVVASQGRHNADGTVRLAPGNHEVTGVALGRVPDTQRRRRNKLVEAKTVSSL